MNDEHSARGLLPRWYLETFGVVQDVDGGLRNVELRVRDALSMATLDRRVRRELEALLESLHTIQGNLVLVDMAARAALDETSDEAA